MQEAKFDKGKPKLTLVPRQIIFDIAEVREYGVEKYKDPDNWKKVEVERYCDALYRHMMAFLDDPEGVDAESGIKHYKHMACNMAFICEMMKNQKEVPKLVIDSNGITINGKLVFEYWDNIIGGNE